MFVSRAKQLLKDTDSAHKYEMDETAALEKMILQVEGNLQATLVKFDVGFFKNA